MVVYPKDHELTLKGWLTPNLIVAWRREWRYTWAWWNKCSLVSQRKYLTRSVKKTKSRIHPFPTPPSQMHADRTRFGGRKSNRKTKHRLNTLYVVKRFQGGAKCGKKNLQMLDRVSHVMWKPCKIPGQEPSVLGRMTERGAMPGCCLVGKREAPTWLGCNTELCHCSSAPGSTTSGTAQSKGHGQDAAKARIANISAAAGDLAQERRSSAIWRVTSALTFSRWGIIFGLSSSTLTIS